MSTSRSTVYAWAMHLLEAEPTLTADELRERTVAHFEEDFDLMFDLARQAIGLTTATVAAHMRHRLATSSQPTSSPQPVKRLPREQLRREIEREIAAMPPDAPMARIDTSPKVKADVYADLASMTKLEVISFADRLSNDSVAAARMAALCRRIAKDLSGTEKVADRFTRDDLLRTMNLITVNTTTRVFIGQKQVELLERTNS